MYRYNIYYNIYGILIDIIDVYQYLCIIIDIDRWYTKPAPCFERKDVDDWFFDMSTDDELASFWDGLKHVKTTNRNWYHLVI